MHYRCSRCGRQIEDLTIKITTHYEILKNTEEGSFSEFNNINEATSEYLCEDCFNLYCDCLNKMNENIITPVDIATEIVDDVVYGDINMEKTK